MFNLQTTLVGFEYQKKLKTCIINKIGLSIGVTHKGCLHVRGNGYVKRRQMRTKGGGWCIYTAMAASISLENVLNAILRQDVLNISYF